MMDNFVKFLLSDNAVFTIIPAMCASMFWTWYGITQRIHKVMWRKHLLRMATRIHRETLLGIVHPDELIHNHMRIDGHIVGWIEMGTVYQKYINDLPIHERRGLIDVVLQNASKRAKHGSSDIGVAVGMMNHAELETVMYAIGGQFNAYDISGRMIRNMVLPPENLANEIITFMLTHPA